MNKFLGVLGVFSVFWRPKTAKSKIYLDFEVAGASVVALSLGRWWWPLMQVACSCSLSLGVFRPFLPAFCPLSCFMLVASLANMALFRVLRGFLARFGVRMYIYMGLVLCVDCVAFVRVWS